MIFVLLGLLILGPVMGAAAFWQARRALGAAESVRGELRALRLQVGNVIDLLTAAGFKKPKRPGWEDDWKETVVRDSESPELSWMQPRQKGDS